MSEKYLGEVSTPLLINQIKEKCALQYSTMPTPSASLVGKIAQYVGVTTSNYTNGYWYKCVGNGDPIVYSWDEIDTQAVDLSYVTPQDYGAKADGVTNDTLAVKSAIEHGENVYFPSGKYLVDWNTISVILTQDIVIYGDGKDESIIVLNSSDTLSGYGYALKFASTNNNINFTIKNIGIIYNNSDTVLDANHNDYTLLYLIGQYHNINGDNIYIYTN